MRSFYINNIQPRKVGKHFSAELELLDTIMVLGLDFKILESRLAF